LSPGGRASFGGRFGFVWWGLQDDQFVVADEVDASVFCADAA
jgi:hypothetical protein